MTKSIPNSPGEINIERKNDGSVMTETIIKSSIPGVRDLLIARAADCVVIRKVVDGNPMTSTLVAVPLEDIPALIKALQPFANEVHERESL